MTLLGSLDEPEKAQHRCMSLWLQGAEANLGSFLGGPFFFL